MPILAGDQASSSWLSVSIAAFVPALALGFGSGAFGLASHKGMALGGAAFAYLLLDLLVLQRALNRRYDRKVVVGVSLSAYARSFLARAHELHSVAELGSEMAMAAQNALGIRRCSLVVAGAEPGSAVEHDFAMGGQGVPLVGADRAFAFLAELDAPVTRAQLTALANDPGAQAATELLVRMSGEVLLPLKFGPALLGVAALSAPARAFPEPSVDGFYRALAAMGGIALAGAYGRVEKTIEEDGPHLLAGLASAIETALMPFDKPIRCGKLVVRGVFRPMSDCGGNLWAHRELNDGRLFLFMGDAAGVGIEAAVLTALAKGNIDALCLDSGAALDPAKVLGSLNNAIYEACGRAGFTMTAVAALLDPKSGQIAFANAGHEAPYLIRKDAKGPMVIEVLKSVGNVLGTSPDAKYLCQMRPFSGTDRLLMFTDGLLNAGLPHGVRFGEDKLRETLTKTSAPSAGALPDVIMAEVDRHLAGVPAADDITVLAVGAFAPGDAGARPS